MIPIFYRTVLISSVVVSMEREASLVPSLQFSQHFIISSLRIVELGQISQYNDWAKDEIAEESSFDFRQRKDVLPTRQRPQLLWGQRSPSVIRHGVKILTTHLHMGLKIKNEWSYNLHPNMPLWDAHRQFYLSFTNKFHSHSFPDILLNYHHATIFLQKIIIFQLLQNFFALT